MSADARGQTVDRDSVLFCADSDQALLTNPGCCAGGGPGHVLSPRPQAQRPPDVLRGWVSVSESRPGPRSWPTGLMFSTTGLFSACGETQVGDPQERNLPARLGEEKKRRGRLGECSSWQEAVAPPSHPHLLPSQPHAYAHAVKATGALEEDLDCGGILCLNDSLRGDTTPLRTSRSVIHSARPRDIQSACLRQKHTHHAYHAAAADVPPQKTPDRGFARAERPDGARLLPPRVLRENRGPGGCAERLGEAGKILKSPLCSDFMMVNNVRGH